jgi:predicted metal-dependent enzyme (double-stranded beta helix superfamily)
VGDFFLVWLHAHPLLGLVGVIAGGATVSAYALTGRDLIRRGLRHRSAERLAAQGVVSALPSGRVACPECAEAILKEARRCPFCRSVVIGRV